jgi:hypothetical protein
MVVFLPVKAHPLQKAFPTGWQSLQLCKAKPQSDLELSFLGSFHFSTFPWFLFRNSPIVTSSHTRKVWLKWVKFFPLSFSGR